MLAIVVRAWQAGRQFFEKLRCFLKTAPMRLHDHLDGGNFGWFARFGGYARYGALWERASRILPRESRDIESSGGFSTMAVVGVFPTGDWLRRWGFPPLASGVDPHWTSIFAGLAPGV